MKNKKPKETDVLKKEKKRIERSKIKDINQFTKAGDKADGVSEGGIYSRTVTSRDGTTKEELYMLKNMDPYSTASEYIGSNIARLFLGDAAPVVELVRGENGKVFVASKFIANFETLKSLSARIDLPKKCFPYGCVVDVDGNIYSTITYLQLSLVQGKKNNPQIENAELVNIVADYIQHGDAHDRNVGVIKDVTQLDKYTTALIDYSWSLRGASPQSSIIYTDYAKNYDADKVIKAIDKVLAISPAKIKKITAPLFKNLIKLYGEKNAVFKESVPPSNYPLHILDLAQQEVQNFLNIDWSNKKNLKEVQENMIQSLENRATILTNERSRIMNELRELYPYGRNNTSSEENFHEEVRPNFMIPNLENQETIYLNISNMPLIKENNLAKIGRKTFNPQNQSDVIKTVAVTAAAAIVTGKIVKRAVDGIFKKNNGGNKSIK